MWRTIWRIKYGLAGSSAALMGLLLSWVNDLQALAIAYVLTGLFLSGQGRFAGRSRQQ